MCVSLTGQDSSVFVSLLGQLRLDVIPGRPRPTTDLWEAPHTQEAVSSCLHLLRKSRRQTVQAEREKNHSQSFKVFNLSHRIQYVHVNCMYGINTG